MFATNMQQILPLVLSSLTCSLQQIAAILLGQYHQEKCLASFWSHVAMDALLIQLTLSEKQWQNNLIHTISKIIIISSIIFQ
jgi:hypothetical protein